MAVPDKDARRPSSWLPRVLLRVRPVQPVRRRELLNNSVILLNSGQPSADRGAHKHQRALSALILAHFYTVSALAL